MFVTPTGDGFAAIGTFVDDGWWIGRSDGHDAWTIAPLPNVPRDEVAVGLADRGAGVVAWFASTAGDISAVTTETGEIWRSTEAQGLAGASVGRVIRAATGYVALAELPDASAGLFVSRDGVHWRAVTGPIDGSPGSYVGLAIAGERAILLGEVRVGDEGTPTVWSGPASLFEP
jgi:hypothetical protein